MKPADEKERMDANEYLRVCGALVWPASMTRPDIQYAVSVLCSFAQCAGQTHLNAAIGVVAYLHKTRRLGITYGGRIDTPLGLTDSPRYYHESSGLHAYHDSSWGKEPYAWGGYVVMYMGGALTWKASKLKIVADSSAEAETAVASRAAKAVVAVRAILDEIKRPVGGATAMLGDNQAARDTVIKPGCTARTRHF